MASGIDHDRSIQRCSLVGAMLGVVLVIGRQVSLLSTAIFLGAFWFGGMYLSPDLDTVSRPYRRWGILRLYWKPYLDLVKHRSQLSHSIGLGAAVRFGYCLFPAALAASIGWGPGAFIVMVLTHWNVMLLAFLGVQAADLVHFYMDGILFK